MGFKSWAACLCFLRTHWLIITAWKVQWPLPRGQWGLCHTADTKLFSLALFNSGYLLYRLLPKKSASTLSCNLRPCTPYRLLPGCIHQSCVCNFSSQALFEDAYWPLIICAFCQRVKSTTLLLIDCCVQQRDFVPSEHIEVDALRSSKAMCKQWCRHRSL
jgi:hypothetical protein